MDTECLQHMRLMQTHGLGVYPSPSFSLTSFAKRTMVTTLVLIYSLDIDHTVPRIHRHPYVNADRDLDSKTHQTTPVAFATATLCRWY